VLDGDHPSLATGLNSLAGLYWAQLKYDEALPLFNEVLQIRRRAAKGADHPEVATALNNLAIVYQAQGKMDQAKRAGAEALQIAERVLGPDHPDTKNYLEWWGAGPG